MVEYGIGTTKADYWVHLFPSDRAVYWYRVEAMREYISITKPVVRLGHSKDDSPTGAGYCIPKGLFFVTRVEVDERYFEPDNWETLSDRQAGRRGQHIIFVLIEHGIVKLPFARVKLLKTQAEQFSGRDYTVNYFETAHVEAKTERKESANLFVQTREGQHNPNLAFEDGKIIERVTALSDEVPF